MGGITSSFNLSVGSGLSGAGTVASPLTNAGVTSVATNNGLTGGTITSSGTIGLDVYNGTTYNYTSYAIGTSLYVGSGVNSSAVNANAALTVYAPIGTCTYEKGVFHLNTGYGSALSGTWRARGYFSVPPCNAIGALMTRTA